MMPSAHALSRYWH